MSPATSVKHGLVPMRLVGVWLSAFVCGLALVVVFASAAMASDQIVATAQPLESSCPAAAGRPPEPGSHCVPVPVSMIQNESAGPGPTCGQSVFMQVPLLKGIVEYGALWTNVNEGATPWLFTASGGRHGSGSGPYGEEAYSTKALTPQNTGVNVNYTVPKGSGAWFVAAGGGPAPCDLRPGTAVAWGWTARYAVSGRLTIAGSGGSPAARVRVQASCPSGGSTTTDTDGAYEFLLDRGPCTIAPLLRAGKTAKPRQRALNVTHTISHVDFQVPCSAVPVARSAGGPALASAAAASAGGCGLIVTITWPHMKAPRTAGLSWQPADPASTLDFGPLFIRRGASATGGGGTTGEGADACASGCTNVTVTVQARDPATGALVTVDDATLDAKVTPIKTNAFLADSKQPAGYLCADQSGHVICGGDIPNLRTTSGRLSLIYWAPGVITPESPSITVSAVEKCSASACPLEHRHGTGRKTLTLAPHTLLSSRITLTDEEKLLMIRWAESKSASDLLNTIGNTLLNKNVPDVYDVLWAILLGDDNPAFAWSKAVVEAALGDQSDRAQDEQVFTALFLARFHVPEVSLGSDDMNWCFSCHNLSPLVAAPFLDAFANWPVTRLGHHGILYKYAQALSAFPVDEPATVRLTIDEVSYCAQDNAETGCGPGYFAPNTLDNGIPPACNLPFTTDETANDGIKAYLYFHFDATNRTNAHELNDAITVPYNPYEWMTEKYCPSATP